MPTFSFRKLVVILLLVVSAPVFATSKTDSLSILTLNSESIETPEYKAEVLLNKVLLADPIYIEMQDREFLKDTILTIHKESSASEVECAINTTFKNYRQNLYNILLSYTKEYPKEAIDLWLNTLDFLAQVNAKIINDPEVVDFNINNLPASSALTVMTNSESLKLQSIILDPRFSKLLVLVGLPTLDKNRDLIDMFRLSTLYSFALIQAATDECSGNSALNKQT